LPFHAPNLGARLPAIPPTQLGSVMFARPVQFTEDGGTSEACHDRFREISCVRSVR
jgi:hypothetical protein